MLKKIAEIRAKCDKPLLLYAYYE
jgi:hypothetical protein